MMKMLRAFVAVLSLWAACATPALADYYPPPPGWQLIYTNAPTGTSFLSVVVPSTGDLLVITDDLSPTATASFAVGGVTVAPTVNASDSTCAIVLITRGTTANLSMFNSQARTPGTADCTPGASFGAATTTVSNQIGGVNTSLSISFSGGQFDAGTVWVFKR